MFPPDVYFHEEWVKEADAQWSLCSGNFFCSLESPQDQLHYLPPWPGCCLALQRPLLHPPKRTPASKHAPPFLKTGKWTATGTTLWVTSVRLLQVQDDKKTEVLVDPLGICWLLFLFWGSFPSVFVPWPALYNSSTRSPALDHCVLIHMFNRANITFTASLDGGVLFFHLY